MRTWQRMIKYVAIAFGTFLTVIIIGAIVSAIMLFFGIFIDWDTTDNSYHKEITFTEEYKTETIDFTDKLPEVKKLDIEVEIAQLEIRTGDTLTVKTQNVDKNFVAKMNGHTLFIKDTKNDFFNTNDNYSKIIVYLPDTLKCQETELQTGLGKTYIESLDTEKLDMTTGIGKTVVDELWSNKTKINAGAGSTSIQNANIRDLDLDTGLGSFILSGAISGDNKVNCGVGRVEINITGKLEAYKIKTSTGIGSMKIDGKQATDNATYGDGENTIAINGGVGAVEISFSKII